ncbi:MAG: hypothetical protein WBE72_12335 [Terracidiphilus sp.]
MTLFDHLRFVGVLLVLLGLSHAFFNRYFGWDRELEAVSLLTRRVFFVHTFFIGFGVTLAGAGSLFYARALLRPDALSRAILAGMAAFWLCRLLAQFFAYDSVLWRGDRFRTAMHAAFAVLWCYVTATYGIALIAVWS